jgi:phytoene dehydrogenase-like protein
LPSRVDVVVVGAGLAGLAAATTLSAAGVGVCVVERQDGVGGRVRTDRVDGLLLDRGFQLLNPAYPAVRDLIDLESLDLQAFEGGVVVAIGEGRTVVADPRRSPRRIWSTLTGPGGVREKLAVARWAAHAGWGDPRTIVAGDDGPLAEVLRRRHLDGPLTSMVLEPFLAGVLGEDRQESSRRFVELVLRSFVRGTPALPAAGMQALPEQLAARLPEGALHLSTPVEAVRGTSVVTAAGRVDASTCLVAAGPGPACDLLGLPPVSTRALTTYYHLAEQAPSELAALHVDGERRGPVVNSAVVSNVAPTYAGGRGALVATTVLGRRDDVETEHAVRRQLRWLYGRDVAGWDHVATYAIAEALPAMLPPLTVRRPVDLGEGRFVAGDHRDTATIQGALVSGRRAAHAILGRRGYHRPPKERRAR